MESKQEFPTFYNVKNIQMIAPAQLGEENKTIQYIATQPFTTTTYGQSYALVNPIQIAGAQNGQIVINKPISAVSFRYIMQFFSFNNSCPFLEHNIKYKF